MEGILFTLLGLVIVMMLTIIVSVIASAPKRKKEKQELYNKYKNEFFKYAKLVDEMSNIPEKLGTEEFWNQATSGGRFVVQAVTEIKQTYEMLLKQKKEYDKTVDMLLSAFDESISPQAREEVKSIRKKFEKYYVYDYDYDSVTAIPFTNALKRVIDELQMKKDTYELKKKKGVDAEGLNDVEELFLINAKMVLPRFENMVNKAKSLISEQKMYAEIERLRNEQRRQFQKLERNMSNTKKGLIEAMFDSND